MSSNDRLDYENYPDDALERDITRGTVHDPNYGTEPLADPGAGPADTGGAAAAGPEGPQREPAGLRTGTLVWGVLALLLALWSLSVTVLDWDIDPVLVAIGLAVVGGVALIAGGVVGATRHRTR
jgi:hypothetical protein